MLGDVLFARDESARFGARKRVRARLPFHPEILLVNERVRRRE